MANKYKDMFNITGDQENTNQDHNHIAISLAKFKRLTIPNIE